MKLKIFHQITPRSFITSSSIILKKQGISNKRRQVYLSKHKTLAQCCANVGFDADPALAQHWVNASCLLSNNLLSRSRGLNVIVVSQSVSGKIILDLKIYNCLLLLT